MGFGQVGVKFIDEFGVYFEGMDGVGVGKDNFGESVVLGVDFKDFSFQVGFNNGNDGNYNYDSWGDVEVDEGEFLLDNEGDDKGSDESRQVLEG